MTSGGSDIERIGEHLHAVGVMPTRDPAAIPHLWSACEALLNLVERHEAQIADLEASVRAAHDAIGP